LLTSHQIQHVEAEEWLGALLHANDELVTALMTFEQLDRSIDADSDSDDELAEQQHIYKREYAIHLFYVTNIIVMSDKGKENEATNQLAGLHISKSPNPVKRPPPPPRPVQRPPPEEEEDSVEEEDENDPFADRNAFETPKFEKDEPRWYVDMFLFLMLLIFVQESGLRWVEHICMRGFSVSVDMVLACIVDTGPEWTVQFDGARI
jgi:hypothetical protein